MKKVILYVSVVMLIGCSNSSSSNPETQIDKIEQVSPARADL